MGSNTGWLVALGLLSACSSAPTEEASVPPGEAHLDAPCTIEDEAGGPGSSPMGLAAPGKNQKYAVWPDGRIPYQIDSSLDAASKTSALQAMSDWQIKSKDRVRFELAETSDSPRLVVVGGAAPITNHVGYRSSANSKVTLGKSSSVSLVRHELGHVLGLHHEQRHPEREKYILVKMQNVKNTDLCMDQFTVCASCLPVLDYNVDSVMHYDTDDLSSCHPNGPVLLHLDGSPIKHTWVLTPGDIAAIYALYGAPPGGTGGAGGGGGAGGAGTGGGAGANSGGASGSGGAGGSSADAGLGGAAGNPSAGAGGDDVIDVPDDPGAGAAGRGADSGDSGSCRLGRKPSRDDSWPALVLGAFALSTRRRARRPASPIHQTPCRASAGSTAGRS